MISAKYLYPVCALVLLWAASLFGVYRFAVAGEGGDVVAEAELRLAEEVIGELNYNLEEDIDQFNYLLTDGSKERFMPILPVIEDIRKLRDRYARFAGAEAEACLKFKHNPRKYLHHLKELHHERAAVGLAMLDEAGKLLRRYGEQFDMNRKDVHATNEYFLEEAQSLYAYDLMAAPPADQWAFRHRAALLETGLAVYQQKIVNRLISLSSGRTLRCFLTPPHPFMLTNKLVARRGQAHVLDFGVGDYSTENRPENMALVVGNDTVAFDDRSFASVAVPTDRKGKHAIKVQLLIINPLTGMVKTSGGTYEYYVE